MKNKKKLKVTLIIIFSLCLVTFLGVYTYIQIQIKPLLSQDFELNVENISTKIYDNSYNLVEDYTDNFITIDELNDDTINAFISIEDKEFFNHKGINLKRIVGATLSNIKNKKIVQGASTITQQLVKNKYLTNEKSIKRKIKEAYISKQIEKKYSKDEILESYLNTIYFGNGASGIKNASMKFFNKHPKDLTLNESAVLAGCINSPLNYSPINNIINSKERRNLILKEMFEDGYIENEEYLENTNKDIELNITDTPKNNLYIDYALEEASNILKLDKNEIIQRGYQIYTYQNRDEQKILDKKINDDNYYQENKYGNIADSLGIIINNDNYSVSAISGRSKYNLVNFKRQPGSLIKPIFTYAPAFECGMIAPCTEILDDKISIKGYQPNNVGNRYYDYISVRDILAKSLNIPTVKITEKLGVETCKNFAQNCGIKFDENDCGLSLSLGGMTTGVNLKNITDSYSIFTSSGKYIKSAFIKEIKDVNNITIYSRNMTESKVCSSDTSYLMTNCLMHAVNNGTSKKISKLPFQVAGKTGTVSLPNSNDNSDAYSLAYTTKNTMAVWLGNYSMDDEFFLSSSNNGGTFCTEIIRDTFNEIYSKNIPQNFEIPDTIIKCKIDTKCLQEDHEIKLANYTPERYTCEEIFSINFPPTELSNKFNNCEPFDFNLSIENNVAQISFIPKDYINYEIYKNNKLLKTISNENDEFKYFDNDIRNNVKYDYYIKGINKFSSIEYTTDIKSICNKIDYNNYLKYNDDYSFIFS